MQRGSRGGGEGGEGREGSDGGRRDSQIGRRREGEKEINLPACRRRPKEDDGRGFPLQKRLPSDGKKKSRSIEFFFHFKWRNQGKTCAKVQHNAMDKNCLKMHKNMSLRVF